MGGGFFDPRATAMSSMVTGFGGGMRRHGRHARCWLTDPSEAALRDTVSEALGNGAKAAMEQLGKKK